MEEKIQKLKCNIFQCREFNNKIKIIFVNKYITTYSFKKFLYFYLNFFILIILTP